MRLVLAFLLSMALAVGVADRARADRDGDVAATAAIAFGALALGALAASSSRKYHKQRLHAPERRYGAPFKPHKHVTCYPARAVCLRDNGRVARKATKRYFW